MLIGMGLLSAPEAWWTLSSSSPRRWPLALSTLRTEAGISTGAGHVQGYLAHKKQPLPLGTP